MGFEGSDLNLEATELRLGLPGSTSTSSTSTSTSTSTTITKLEEAKSNKRSFPDMNHKDEKDQPSTTSKFNAKKNDQENIPSPPKAQVVGWPPVRSYRKNCLQAAAAAKKVEIYVKVSMDGAPYLRKIDLNLYTAYPDLLKALEDMFHFKAGEYSEREGYNGSEFVPTYEDKDGDWMLVGDVPWDMFINSCKRLRIMKGSEAKGLGCAV